MGPQNINNIHLGQKWSPYENKSGGKSGVTNYAGGRDRETLQLKRALTNILEVFKVPAYQIFPRQKKAFDHLAKSPFTDVGLGLGVGENFCASSHTGA